MSVILSTFFWLALYLVVILLVAFFLPLSIFIKNTNFVNSCTRFWSRAVLIFLKTFLRIDHKIIGLENLPKDEPFIIACKHQSMWDTVIFHTIIDKPSYVYKKELLKIPVYGWYVKKMPCIEIDRSGGAKALKDMVKKSKNYLKTGHKIIIFPQGTRTPINSTKEEYPYQVGVAALYSACKVKVVPVALNSGKFWGKGMLIKKSGCITLKFLKPIESGLKKDEFMEKLEDSIETESNKLSS